MSTYDQPLSPMQAAALAHPSAETRTRFVADEAIRKCGWEIRSRPKKGPVLWSKRMDGDELVLTQAEVIEGERLDSLGAIAE